MASEQTIWPDEACVAQGAKFSSHIDREGFGRTGVVRCEHGEICWRYGLGKNGLRRPWGNPLPKKDFVIASVQTGEEITFRRESFFPSRFTILDARGVQGSVCMQSILRNRYKIETVGSEPRIFRMPLFTLQFWGGVAESPDFWVMVGPSKMDWNILIKPGIDEQPMVAALSFIHNQWWNYS